MSEGMDSPTGFNYVRKRKEGTHRLEKGIGSKVDLVTYFRLQCSPIPTPISRLFSFSLKVTVKNSNQKSSTSSPHTKTIPPTSRRKRIFIEENYGFRIGGKG